MVARRSSWVPPKSYQKTLNRKDSKLDLNQVEVEKEFNELKEIQETNQEIYNLTISNQEKLELRETSDHHLSHLGVSSWRGTKLT